MWERLDLLEVGIPTTTSSKVVLTTRCEHLCGEMEVDERFRVECLTPDEAFSLFCDKVGEKLLNSHPDIRRLARVVVEQCKGLPLALVVIGRSMASRKTPQEWEQAIQVLRSYPARFSGIPDQVFSTLKFSYDDLDNDTTKSCFLYCSLFPEDYEINNEELIDLWIGEGFLDKFGDIHEARDQGEEIIRSLKLACVLEGPAEEDYCKMQLACVLEGTAEEDYCKMHDVIRDMALWISCDCEKEKHKSVVLDNVKLVEAYDILRWEDARHIALWGSTLDAQLSVSPSFLNLQTLILRGSRMKSLPVGFFQNMPLIRVLDLAYNAELEELPPEICKLESLEYLNLSATGIKNMPVQVKNWTKLRCLIVDHVNKDHVVPPNVISCLPNLQMFSRCGGGNIWGDEEVGVLEELENLRYLSEIRVSLYTLPAANKILTSQKLKKWLRDVSFNHIRGLKEVELPLSTLQRLRFLLIKDMDDLERVNINTGNDHHQGIISRGCISNNSSFHKLVAVRISGCDRILDLTWVIYARSLRTLNVQRCAEIREIIGVSDQICEEQSHDLGMFSRLNILFLRNLPNLRSIYSPGFAVSFTERDRGV